uniref:Uncharacterized protein n=1 Tax=Romanomermis culicivorax TaxID=13658 RepID=A0A915J9E6_ROMCU
MLTRNRIVSLKHIVSQCLSMTMESEIEKEKQEQQQKLLSQNGEKLMWNKIRILDQENRRLMAAQHRLVVETNKRTDVYQASLVHLNMELTNLRRRNNDLQLAYVGLLNKNKSFNQMLQNQSHSNFHDKTLLKL